MLAQIQFEYNKPHISYTDLYHMIPSTPPSQKGCNYGICANQTSLTLTIIVNSINIYVSN